MEEERRGRGVAAPPLFLLLFLFAHLLLLLLLLLLDTGKPAWNPRHFSATKTPDRQRGAAVLFERRHQGSGLSFGVSLLNSTQTDKLWNFCMKYQLIQNVPRQLRPSLLYDTVHRIDFWNDTPCMLMHVNPLRGRERALMSQNSPTRRIWRRSRRKKNTNII